MKNKLNLQEKAIHLFNWMTLLVVLFFPSYITHYIYPTAISTLLGIILILCGISWYRRLKSSDFPSFHVLFAIISQCLYCTFIWLIYLYQIPSEWLLAGLLFLLAVFYIFVTIRKQIDVNNAQLLIEIAVNFIIIFVAWDSNW